MDHVDRAVEFARGFIKGLGVNGHDIRLALEEPRKLVQRVGNHQVHVERHGVDEMIHGGPFAARRFASRPLDRVRALCVALAPDYSTPSS